MKNEFALFRYRRDRSRDPQLATLKRNSPKMTEEEYLYSLENLVSNFFN